MVLALVLKVLTELALVLIIVAQSYLIFTDLLTLIIVNNIGLRDASASKKKIQIANQNFGF